MHGEHRQGQSGADATHGLHSFEDGAPVSVGKSVEGERVLPDDQRGGQARRRPVPQTRRGRRGDVHEDADPSDQPDYVAEGIRRRDAERLALQMTGDIYSGQSLIIGNAEHTVRT